MLCCHDNPSYTPLDTHDRTSIGNNCSHRPRDWNQFPGCARTPSNATAPPDSVLLKTGGNALTAVDVNAASAGMVAVSVPDGVKPGQNILVTMPDDSRKLVSAVVPDGALPGHTFLVSFPAVEADPVVATGVPVNPEAENTTGLKLEASQLAEVKGEEVAVSNEHSGFQVRHDAQDLLLNPEPATNTNETLNGESSRQNLVLVQVPPGTAPGSKVHVNMPGSDKRTVEAIVPEGNISQFYVDVPQRTTGSLQITQSNRNVVLVQVPPGTAPGSKLHVQLPGNDFGVVEAVVPEGNISQFYVELPSRDEENRSGTNVHDNSLAPLPSLV